jgi:UDP-4-amino-4,6-dideoxy-N-acetyl-beta-L-altrosamine N-acetyltransferase
MKSGAAMLKLSDYSLREIEERDFGVLFLWRNAAHIRAASFSNHVTTQTEHLRWFHEIGCDYRSKRLVFEWRGTACGLLTLQNINKISGTTEWGLYLGSTDLPKGTGTALAYCGLEYAFSALGIRKVSSQILSNNLRSIALHRKLGFIEEGCLRYHVKREEECHDVLIMALFSEKWLDEFKNVVKMNLFMP